MHYENFTLHQPTQWGHHYDPRDLFSSPRMSQSCVPSNTEPPKIYPNIGDIIGTLQYISMRTYSTSKIGPWEYRKLGIQGAGNIGSGRYHTLGSLGRTSENRVLKMWEYKTLGERTQDLENKGPWKYRALETQDIGPWQNRVMGI